jgi:hypothetical protein
VRYRQAGGARSAVAAILLLPLLLAGAGCASTALYETTDRYYAEGPEKAIQTIDRGEFRSADRTLAALEKAVSLLELGDYAASAALLDGCADALDRARHDPGTALASVLANDEAGAYHAEAFERVLVPTLALCDVLALQDLDAAAVEAERALAAVDTAPCPACRFAFTRYLAAIAFEEMGDRERALSTLAEAVAESPDLPFLNAELERMAGDEECPAVDPEPEPASPPGTRVLYVLLLLGRGPQKVPEGVAVPWSHEVVWPRYVPRLPEGVTGARLEVAGGPGRDSVPLSDVAALAERSLRARLGGLVAKESVKTVAQEAVVQSLGDDYGWEAELFGRTLFALFDRADLRHWSTLPASCQVLRVPLPDDVAACDLVYLTPDGLEVDRETLDLPAAWQQGALFVTRRMP